MSPDMVDYPLAIAPCLAIQPTGKCGHEFGCQTGLRLEGRGGQTTPYPAKGVNHRLGGWADFFSLSGSAAMVGDPSHRLASPAVADRESVWGVDRGCVGRRIGTVACAPLCTRGLGQRHPSHKIRRAWGRATSLAARAASEVLWRACE